jgi:hypothetical protein
LIVDLLTSQAVNSLQKAAGLGLMIAPPAAEVPHLARIFQVVASGVAAGHVSIGKFEVNELGCVRIGLRGTRVVVIINTMHLQLHCQDIGSTGDILSWVQKAGPEDIQNYLNAGRQLWWGTVGPNDTLFIPTGFVVCHRIMASEDCVGVRLGASIKDIAVMERTINLHSKSGQLPNDIIKDMLPLVRAQSDQTLVAPAHLPENPGVPPESQPGKVDEPPVASGPLTMAPPLDFLVFSAS